MLRISCLLVLTTLAPAQAAPQDHPVQGRSLKILPVADLLFHTSSIRPPRLGRLSRVRENDHTFVSLLARYDYHVLEGDQLLDLVRNHVRDDADEISLVLRDRTLLITAQAERVAKVVNTVDSLRRAMTQRSTVRAFLYRIDGTKAYPAVATIAQLAELTDGLPLLWTAHAESLSGQQVLLAQEKYSRYIYDADVEVAEESTIGAPKTTSMFEGVRLIVENHALIGTTERVFKCQVAIGEREKAISLQPVGIQGLPAIGQPHLRATSGSFSGRIPHDGALMVSIRSRSDAGSNLLLVVQSKSLAGPAVNEVSVGRTLLLPISAMTSGSLRNRVQLTSEDEEDQEGSYGDYPSFELMDEDQEFGGDNLVALLNESLGSMIEDEDTAVSVTNNGHCAGFLLLRGSEAMRTAARRLMIKLQDELLTSVEVQLRTDLHRSPETRSTFTEITPDSTQPVGVFHALTFPCLTHHTSLFMKGVESAVIRDFEVEIASKASIANPEVQTTFSGVFSLVRPVPQDNHLGADLRLMLNHHAPAYRQSTGHSKGGDIYNVRVHKAYFHHGGRVLNRDMPLGWGPRVGAEGKHLRTHQSVRFRKL